MLVQRNTAVHIRKPLSVCLVALAALPGSSLASGAAQDEPAVTVTASVAPSAAQENPFGVDPMSDGELARVTGREESGAMLAFSRNNAVVAENQVGDNSTTGSVVISDSAFNNTSGISMVNMNTGNNSAINAAMSINVQINYAAPVP